MTPEELAAWMERLEGRVLALEKKAFKAEAALKENKREARSWARKVGRVRRYLSETISLVHGKKHELEDLYQGFYRWNTSAHKVPTREEFRKILEQQGAKFFRHKGETWVVRG